MKLKSTNTVKSFKKWLICCYLYTFLPDLFCCLDWGYFDFTEELWNKLQQLMYIHDIIRCEQKAVQINKKLLLDKLNHFWRAGATSVFTTQPCSPAQLKSLTVKLRKHRFVIFIFIIISPKWSILGAKRQQEIKLAHQPEASDLENGKSSEE